MNIDTAYKLRKVVFNEYDEEINKIKKLYDEISVKSNKLPEMVDFKLYELAYRLMPRLAQELEGTEDEHKASWEQFQMFADAEYEYFEDWLTDCPNAELVPIGRTSSYIFSSPDGDINEIFEIISEGYYEDVYEFLASEVSILFEIVSLEKAVENYEYLEDVLTYGEQDYIIDIENNMDETIYLLENTLVFLQDALTIYDYIEMFKRNASENYLDYLELEEYMYLVDEIRQKKIA